MGIDIHDRYIIFTNFPVHSMDLQLIIIIFGGIWVCAAQCRRAGEHFDEDGVRYIRVGESPT